MRMTRVGVRRIAGLYQPVFLSVCLSVQFVGVASHPVQCPKTGLKKRNMKCEEPSNAPNSYSRHPHPRPLGEHICCLVTNWPVMTTE